MTKKMINVLDTSITNNFKTSKNKVIDTQIILFNFLSQVYTNVNSQYEIYIFKCQ